MEPTDPTRCGNLTDEQRAILSNRAAADHPQPIDYGLTYDDMRIHGLPSHGRSELKYKEVSRGKHFCILAGWISSFLAVWLLVAILFSFDTKNVMLLVMSIWPAFFIYLILHSAINPIVLAFKRRHPSTGVLAYKEAFQKHRLYLAAADEAEQALQRKKHSYWESLNGYEFERQTAEVLKRYQFNPKVTRGSADGGVDIEVTKGGRKGVVQCKAHVARVAPATVRDLFGVIHHSNSDFGIIVSLGGFTKGAIEFAKSKPIFLLDCSDLIAMQEGQDILAKNFPADPTP
jgi:hypothetical protein